MQISELYELWWENEAGDRFVGGFDDTPPAGYIYQHAQFACSSQRVIWQGTTQAEVDACSHEGKIILNTGLIDGLRGRRCLRCNGTQTVGEFEPWPAKWNVGGAREILRDTVTWSEDLVLAMTRPTEEQQTRARLRATEARAQLQETAGRCKLYTLREAILIASRACERCLNTLYYNYGVDEGTGYYEFSPAWHAAGTICRYCVPQEKLP